MIKYSRAHADLARAYSKSKGSEGGAKESADVMDCWIRNEQNKKNAQEGQRRGFAGIYVVVCVRGAMFTHFF